MTTTTPLSEPAVGPVEGASLVIEAPTAEAALTQLHEQYGADARIVEVRRIARGGIGGFFARELVELHAAPGATTGRSAPPAAPATPAAAAPSAPAEPATPSWEDRFAEAARAASTAASAPTSDAAASPIDRLLQVDAATPDTVDFATFLRSQLGDTAAAPAPGPAAAPLSTHEALLERATAAARQAVRAATGEEETGGVVDPTTDRVIAAPAPAPAAAAVAPAPAPTPAPAPVQVAAPADPIEVVTAAVEPKQVLAADVAMSADLTEPAAATEPGPAWSVAALVKLGLPAGLVRSLEVAEPADDVAWTAALAGALRPVCRPLPSGKSLLIGPRARSVAKGLGVPVTTAGQPIRSRAKTVAAGIGSGAASRRWLERVRGNRWVHVVVGGSGWRELLHFDPLAVSWASTQDVPEAIRLATELGLVLGAGPIGGQVQRARPLDVALAVRSALPESAGTTSMTTDAGDQL